MLFRRGPAAALKVVDDLLVESLEGAGNVAHCLECPGRDIEDGTEDGQARDDERGEPPRPSPARWRPRPASCACRSASWSGAFLRALRSSPVWGRATVPAGLFVTLPSKTPPARGRG